ncbi:hypothetical protein [Hymenobacter sp. 102]|uniref:hypothetical protein n=1 Tax=Hymenobacter sp. 102 TaxID=3403152 RepID=UPI003CF1A7E9
MSIVSQYILIQGEADASISHLLQELNIKEYSAEKEVMLYEANKPKTLFIGRYKNVLIIVHPSWPFDFFGPKQSETESKFIRLFPKAEMAVLISNEQVNAFGYALVRDGVKVRMKDGADGDIFNDFGALLPEEIEVKRRIQKGKILPQEEIAELREDMSEDEVQQYIEFEAWWGVPELIAKRYFDGQTMNHMLGSDTKITRFVKN